MANDHCFALDPDGDWHAFGITHPSTGFERVHLGEHQLFHAAAPVGQLRDALRPGTWRDQPKVLPPAERPGEPRTGNAPHIIKHGYIYYMMYGPTPIRYAVSTDLSAWTPKGALGNAPRGRDPNVVPWNDTYHLVGCAHDEVRIATSADSEAWDQHAPILTMPEGIDSESPFMVRYDDPFYLFVCRWDGNWWAMNVAPLSWSASVIGTTVACPTRCGKGCVLPYYVVDLV